MYIVKVKVISVSRNEGIMYSVCCFKSGVVLYDPQCFSKSDGTSTAVATEAFASVRVEIDHSEVMLGVVLDQDDPIRAHAHLAIAEVANDFFVVRRKGLLTVINHDKIVASALVFMKSYLHEPKI